MALVQSKQISEHPIPMRIAFADFIPWDYNVQTVYQSPMGGTQSAKCYLAEALAAQGHQVHLLTHTSAPGIYRGVACHSLKQITKADFQSWDLQALVLGAGVPRVEQLVSFASPTQSLVFWTGHAHDQPAMQRLRDPATLNTFDGIAMVSKWQKEQFVSTFGIDGQRTALLPYAIAPAFANLFLPGQSILSHKSTPPILAYTSTPFRGLDLLLDAFPAIRQRVPGTTLQVFSSMKVYQISKDADERDFGDLYQRCRDTEGVQYIGSLSQPLLAKALKNVSVLAYPNTFAETCCIAAMEAMAAGCQIVTSNLAALPETTAGFARLIPMYPAKDDYLHRFIDETTSALRQAIEAPQITEDLLQRQVAYANTTLSWQTRADEWTRWLSTLPSLGRVSADGLDSNSSQSGS